MKRALFFTGLVLSVLLIAGCGGTKVEREGPLAISDADLGPETKNLIKELPGGLVGDKDNARHTNETLRGEDEDG
ncbi:MAG: hypothetical protein IH995_03215 [Proteobacteria bacterium]|nr:hypothetical protein [Pseudomonadota bacterium]